MYDALPPPAWGCLLLGLPALLPFTAPEEGWVGDPMSGRDGQIQEQVEAVPRFGRGQVPAAGSWLNVGV